MRRPKGAPSPASPSPLLLAALALGAGLLAAACDPIYRDTGSPTADDDVADDNEGIDVTNLTSGLLNDSGWRLSFRTVSVWEGGNCFEMQLTNNQANATWWQARLTPSAPLGNLGDVSANMLVTWDGEVINVAPWDTGELAEGDSVSWTHCTAPGAGLTDFEIFAVYSDYGADPSEDPEEGPVYGAVVDETGTVALSWQAEVVDGDACLALDVINLGDTVLTDWELTAELAGETNLDLAQDLIFLPVDADTLRILPEAGDTSIAAHGHESGILCISPYVAVESIALTLPEEPADTGEPEEPPAQLSGFLFDSANNIGLSYEENGADSGGSCLDLSFVNLGTVAFNDWTATLGFDADVTATAVTNVFPTGSGSPELALSPTNGIQIIPAFSTVSGRLCLTPRLEPVSFEMTGVLEAP